MNDKWAQALLRRFKGRQDLGKKGLFDKYFMPIGLPEKDVLECFDEIEFDYSIPVGVLRPDDKITKLTEAVSTYNPLKWLFWRPRSEFREADLLDELHVRLKKHGTMEDWKIIDTFEDFVRAWCGQRPNRSGDQ